MTNVRAKKNLGQHFLKDKNIAQKIVDSLAASNIEQVLEVGPGMGVLTQFLLEKKYKTSVVEIDTESVEYLQNHFPELKNNIISADFLKLKLSNYFNQPFAVIGNFPYNISSQIFFKILEYRELIPESVGMIQKEVAERLSTGPGSKTYGILSVLLQAFYNIEYLFTVHENVFIPPPKVKSAVIRLVRNERQKLDCDEKLFFQVVKIAFNQRRKTMRNSLKQFIKTDELKNNDIMAKRPEQLGVKEFESLTRLIEKPVVNTSAMQIEITREFIDKLIELIEAKADAEIQGLVEEVHAADIAEIMEELNTEEAKYLYLLLDEEKASDVLVEIPEYDRKRFLKVLPPEVIASRFIEHMDSDDAADVIADMEEEMQEAVFQEMKDKEQASDIADLLVYDEDTAGGLMAKEMVVVEENWTVYKCLQEISKQAEDIDEIYYVYVIDEDQFLKGILSLKRLILQPTNTKIKNLVTDEIHSVKIDAKQEEVAQIMEKYDLVALPVVDQIGRLKGRITIDDVVDIIREEAEKDYQMVSGISGDVESSDRIWQLTRARIPWLFIGLVGGIFGALVLDKHEASLKEIPALAFFIPLIAAMAGNVGVQSSSIVVQSIASGARDFDTISRKLIKELSVAMITAVLFSSLIFLYNFIDSDDMKLTMAVSFSLFIVILFAAMFGTFVPLILNKFKIDPALATGPFITTTNDIIGLIIYMLIANSLYNFV